MYCLIYKKEKRNTRERNVAYILKVLKYPINEKTHIKLTFFYFKFPVNII